MIIIIGISGKKGAGKDEVYKGICRHFPLAQRIAFADSLKEEVARACIVSVNYIENHKDNFRMILQGWGTDYRRKLNGEDYWLRQWLRKFNNSTAPIVVCPDVRFENEVELIKKLNGHLWKVERHSIECTDNHTSECALDSYKGFDRYVDNNHSLKRLQVEIDLALEMSGLL